MKKNVHRETGGHHIRKAVLALSLMAGFVFLLITANVRISQGEDFSGISPFDGKEYTHASAFQGCQIKHGIDVSKWQTKVNWVDAKAAGVEFAFIRVGNRGYGDAGVISHDGYYYENMEGALAAGIEVGVYFFSQAITEAEAVEEAQYILDRVGDYNVTLPLVMDYEYSPSSTSGRLAEANLSKDEATNICMAFCRTIEEAGYTPMLYANLTMLNNSLNQDVISAKYPVWLARYNTQAGYSGKYTFWQYSSSPVVTWVNTAIETGVGSGAKVDCNFWYYKEGDSFLTGKAAQTPSQTSEPTASPAPPSPSPDSSTEPKGSTQPAGGGNDETVSRISLSKCTISGLEEKYTYTGKQIKPVVTLKYKKQLLENKTDYTVSFENNKKIGSAFLTLKGKGKYKGSLEEEFEIVPAAPASFRVSARSAKSVTLKWTKNNQCTGYIIYRSTKGSAKKKVKTIKKKSITKWKNSGLRKNTTYYYYIQSYKNVDGEKYISDFAQGNLKVLTKK